MHGQDKMLFRVLCAAIKKEASRKYESEGEKKKKRTMQLVLLDVHFVNQCFYGFLCEPFYNKKLVVFLF